LKLKSLIVFEKILEWSPFDLLVQSILKLVKITQEIACPVAEF